MLKHDLQDSRRTNKSGINLSADVELTTITGAFDTTIVPPISVEEILETVKKISDIVKLLERMAYQMRP